MNLPPGDVDRHKTTKRLQQSALCLLNKIPDFNQIVHIFTSKSSKKHVLTCRRHSNLIKNSASPAAIQVRVKNITFYKHLTDNVLFILFDNKKPKILIANYLSFSYNNITTFILFSLSKQSFCKFRRQT